MKPSERVQEFFEGGLGDFLIPVLVIMAFFGWVALAFWFATTFGLLAGAAAMFAPGVLAALLVMGAADGRRK